MTESELTVDFHKDAPRQGPGSTEETIRALELTGMANNDDLKIADIGCGTGSHTIVLAQNTEVYIVGVDLFPGFLDKLEHKAKALGLQDRVTTLAKSMDNLPFGNNEFDIIWSEGAIYNMGFEAGVKKWKNYLKPGGYICVSEITWITGSRPGELEDFWMREYPEVARASTKINFLEDNGFTLAGYFYLNQDSWIDNYYKPMEERFSAFLKRHNNSEIAEEIVKEYKSEIAHYQKYKDYFSYGFYIARKDT
ncbi:class I SAM-dependent methyltransferase [Halalkalibaculum sp. DA384]|uniref:class I SAM-dependent methyltransferase n=1 Tax=Halalkalibaculum sp. DA384 TaxID=3373606 RepID=UPI003754F420